MVSRKSLGPLPKLLSSTVIAQFLGVVVTKLQTTRDVIHLLDSYWLPESYISASNRIPKASRLVAF